MRNCCCIPAVHLLSITLAVAEIGAAPTSIPIPLKRCWEDHRAEGVAFPGAEEEEGSFPSKHYLLLQLSCLQPTCPVLAALTGYVEPHPTALSQAKSLLQPVLTYGFRPSGSSTTNKMQSACIIKSNKNETEHPLCRQQVHCKFMRSYLVEDRVLKGERKGLAKMGESGRGVVNMFSIMKRPDYPLCNKNVHKAELP